MKILCQETIGDSSGELADVSNESVLNVDPTLPNLEYLKSNFSEALQSFYQTVERIMELNPVDAKRLSELATQAKTGSISELEVTELKTLKVAATRQGRAVGGVYGFFLKYKPYAMLGEIREKENFFQPPFGPVLVVGGDVVRDVLARHNEFTVDPYGVEMIKTMTPEENEGFDTFILSTDDDSKYLEDKKLLTAVVNSADPAKLTEIIHQECLCRVRQVVQSSKHGSESQIDVVNPLARFVPVFLCHHYFGVPAAPKKGNFELPEDMLRYYGKKVAGPDGKTPLPMRHQRSDGTIIDLPDTALSEKDGVIPDEEQIYFWIKAAFRNFFNNVQKDVEVQVHGVRACRELLAYILREIDLKRQDLLKGKTVPDTMLTRLLKLQMGIDDPDIKLPNDIDPRRVGDLRIAENIMGTVVGAVAGQEEATCRVIDSIIRLKEGDFGVHENADLSGEQRHGSYDEVRELAINVLEQRNVVESRRQLLMYVLEALRLQPQGEILLRECKKDGATISGSRPIRAGTLIFNAHGSAMRDVDNAGSFIIGRDKEDYLQFGYGRHKCLGQYVSPIIMVETLISLLALEGLSRPEPKAGETSFPLERRFGRFQLDENNMYSKTFILKFANSGTTRQYYTQE